MFNQGTSGTNFQGELGKSFKVERQEELGLNVDMTKFRMYDYALGRFTSIDPLADANPQESWTPYQYAYNNPIRYNDPYGDCPNCITGLIGGLIGGAVGGLIEAGTQLYNNGSITDWSAVGGSAAQGAITGAAAGFTGGASLVVTAGATGTANAVGGAVNRTIQGQETTVGDVVTDATVGAVLGAGSQAVGNVVKNATNNLSNPAKGKLGEAVTEIKGAVQGFKSQGKAVVKTGGKTPTGREAVAKFDHKMKNVFTGSRKTVESKFNTSGLTPNQKAVAGNVTTPGGLIIDRTTSQQLGNAAKTVTGGTGAGAATQINKRENN
jgi:RHS repeat-associated protein